MLYMCVCVLDMALAKQRLVTDEVYAVCVCVLDIALAKQRLVTDEVYAVYVCVCVRHGIGEAATCD